MTSPPDDVRRRGRNRMPGEAAAKIAGGEPAIDVRWQCPLGHFVAFSAIQCEDERDDFAYHGVRSVCSYECRACGETHHEMPRAVVVGGVA